MNTLLVYPQYPDTFWSFKHILKFLSKKALFPPLGLLTIAAMLPKEWNKNFIDLNVSTLQDEHIKWADYVFISAMITQKESVKEVVDRCNKLGTKVIAGGPVFTTGHEEFEGIDHFVLGEAEITLPLFLKDLRNDCAKQVYSSDKYPDIKLSPIPLWNLINIDHYYMMPTQYSRGCPFDCEFCDIIILNGRVPRTKNISQLLQEFYALYKTGLRGYVFIVDDNFIGNKAKAMKILPAIIKWQKENKYPFRLMTQLTLDLADDEELIQMMVHAGFERFFVGLETPNKKSLDECNKFPNKGRDMVAAVKTIHNYGIEVSGGFIVGFDNDPKSIFDSQISLIQNTGIIFAMVGLLQALPKTRLYNRLRYEGRLLKPSSGNNMDSFLNFIPKMDSETVINGYKRILQTIYSPKNYYDRINTFLEDFKPVKRPRRIKFYEIKGFIQSIWHLGIVGGEKGEYWKFIIRSFFKHPRKFPEAIIFAFYGIHLRKVVVAISKSNGFI
ncbi:MAG: DUF4070 domain-containing protein [Deltaproteobacteria bacterium]|nr:MAG: DUF4070 domain-containing protein [Deltaproteobacteria bacterium]